MEEKEAIILDDTQNEQTKKDVMKVSVDFDDSKITLSRNWSSFEITKQELKILVALSDVLK